MRCPECGRWKRILVENRLERTGRFELVAVGCGCEASNEALLRLLTQLAMFGMDPMAPPVLGSPMAG